MDNKATFRQINDAILGASPELARKFDEQYDKWYGLALSDIALLIEGSSIQFADALIDTDLPGADTVTIRLFTDELLVTVKADGGGSPEGRQTSARSRTGLRRLAVEAGTSALGDTWPASWPGAVRITLEYADGETVTIPAGASSLDSARAVAFLPSLRADLGRGTATA